MKDYIFVGQMVEFLSSLGTLDSLLSYCASNAKDPKTDGLHKKVGTEIFVSMTYAMMDIPQPVMELSLTLQKKDLDLGTVQV